MFHYRPSHLYVLPIFPQLLFTEFFNDRFTCLQPRQKYHFSHILSFSFSSSLLSFLPSLILSSLFFSTYHTTMSGTLESSHILKPIKQIKHFHEDTVSNDRPITTYFVFLSVFLILPNKLAYNHKIDYNRFNFFLFFTCKLMI